MKAKVPRGIPASLGPAQELDRSVGSLMLAHPRWAEEREMVGSRVCRFSPWVLGILAAAPLAPASGQNLDAGKPASQIFAEVCSNCHRSPRELRSNPDAGFLGEHYTTGSEMASDMAAYLSSTGSNPRAGAPQPKRQPNPATPAGTATAREPPAADASRGLRRVQQTGDPKAASSGSTRSRPGSARTESTAETERPPAPPLSSAAKTERPPAPPLPAPPLEEFEE